MKNFIYLVQGKAELMKNYLHLLDSPNSDAIFLTYDHPMEEAIFFPNSTWTQGRNKLLDAALSKKDYFYYIFCDDDIKFTKGSWEIFENQLLTYNPAIAVPINPKTIETPLKGFKYQSFLTNDEQLIAFHQDVIRDFIVLPYQEKFDTIYWWIACQIQEVLIQNFYYSDSIQFNNIRISNDAGENYVRPESESDYENLHKLVDDWLSDQFLFDYKDLPSPKRQPIFMLARTFSYYFRHLLGTPKYSVSFNNIKKILSIDSELFMQTTNLRRGLEHLE
jgi:hypothetical protein